MSFLRREGPLIFTSVVAFFLIIEYYIANSQLTLIATFLNRSAMIVGAFLLGFGIINMTLIHTKNIIQRKPKWPFSLYLLILLFVTLVAGLIPPLGSNYYYLWLFNNIYTPLDPAIFSLIAFFIISTAFRALKIRNLEVSLMLLFTVVVILRNAPIGPATFPPIGWLGDWVIISINTGVQRALNLVVALGAIAYGVRILLGVERGYLKGAG